MFFPIIIYCCIKFTVLLLCFTQYCLLIYIFIIRFFFFIFILFTSPFTLHDFVNFDFRKVNLILFPHFHPIGTITISSVYFINPTQLSFVSRFFINLLIVISYSNGIILFYEYLPVFPPCSLCVPSVLCISFSLSFY